MKLKILRKTAKALNNRAEWLRNSAKWLHNRAKGLRNSAKWLRNSAEWLHNRAEWLHNRAEWLNNSAEWLHNRAKGFHIRARWLSVYSFLLVAGTAMLLFTGIATQENSDQIDEAQRLRQNRAEIRLKRVETRTEEELQRIAAAEKRLRRAEARLEQAIADQRSRHQLFAISMDRMLQERIERLRVETGLQVSETSQQAQEAHRQAEATTLARLETLREEVRLELNGQKARMEKQEKKLLREVADRTEVARLRQGRFKRTFQQNRAAILFIRTQYEVKFFGSEEMQTLTGFGTGFFISPIGVGMTAQHVLFPWLYNKRLRVLEKLGMAHVYPETRTITMWLTDTRVMDDEVKPPRFFAEAAYQQGRGRNDIRILHIPALEEKMETLDSPMGMLDVKMPQLGKSDLVVFQVLDFNRRFSFVPLSQRDEAVAALDEIMVVGYPLSRLQNGMAAPQPSRGRVRRVARDYLELDSPLHPGNSGGPVLDGRGQAIGLASAILDSPVYGVAVRAEDLRAAWRAVKDATREKQRRLQALGCDPGAIDGIPGRRTWQAVACGKHLDEPLAKVVNPDPFDR